MVNLRLSYCVDILANEPSFGMFRKGEHGYDTS